MTAQPRKTVLYDRHVSLEADIVEFGGWQMPLQYRAGIVQEHLSTRKQAGLFDVSHMGRFCIRGSGALNFMQHVLSNNVAALEVGQGQYTLIPNECGTAIDDAYLYRFTGSEYLLVVNAANREAVWNHLHSIQTAFIPVEIIDQTDELAMFSLQGPLSKDILQGVLGSGVLPDPIRNHLSHAKINGADVFIARTGYTGEPIGFELFVSSSHAPIFWDLILKRDAVPVGLGARDTLRLEAGLPLYGHELGIDPEGNDIPIFSSGLSKFAVSFSRMKGDFVGRQPLEKQFTALKGIIDGTYSHREFLPRIIMPVAITDKGVARAGNLIFHRGKPAGVLTSGTMVPYWKVQGDGVWSYLKADSGMRAIGLALVDSDLREDDEIEIAVRGKKVVARIVPYHLKSDAPPFARPVIWHKPAISTASDLSNRMTTAAVTTLLTKTIVNSRWRQRDCINLIPSEQTPSVMVRRLSVMDPAGRYAEHKRIAAFQDSEVFYYQGTEFIAEIEHMLKQELCRFLGCSQIETRPISGQMANAAVFSALVDHLNRSDRKNEQQRIRRVLNHHIIRGGHLSAQPMGALRDFIARDPVTERPSAVNFPKQKDNPYKIDISACRKIISEYRPELIILGKSMTLHPEPVAELRAIVDELSVKCVIMYDMAHTLGLVGPYFQQPFKEGVDILTGSTHKTFFGTQRGIIAADYSEPDTHVGLWKAIERRTFPGSVSNHHLGTMLGLLMATYEMNYFKDSYQKTILENAKAFAAALKQCGLEVAGDPAVSYTQTHQVILLVGYAKGPDVARRLEENNIIVNYQATAEDEGFTAASAVRMGVAEMTRFGMTATDFEELAQLIFEVIVLHKNIKEKVTDFRKRFLEMRFCFTGSEFENLMNKLHQLV